MEMTQTYRTSDIYIASWLLSKGLQLEGLDRRNPRRIDFIFQIGQIGLNWLINFCVGQRQPMSLTSFFI